MLLIAGLGWLLGSGLSPVALPVAALWAANLAYVVAQYHIGLRANAHASGRVRPTLADRILSRRWSRSSRCARERVACWARCSTPVSSSRAARSHSTCLTRASRAGHAVRIMAICPPPEPPRAEDGSDGLDRGLAGAAHARHEANQAAEIRRWVAEIDQITDAYKARTAPEAVSRAA